MEHHLSGTGNVRIVDTVEFRLRAPAPAEGSSPDEQEISILVNDGQLQDLARDAELPFAAAEGHPDLAGSYAGLSVYSIRGNAAHFLGEPVAPWLKAGDGTVLLLCESCGESGCWSLAARIEVTADTVMWRNFQNNSRRWDLSALGPFEFDRTQYESALQQI